MLHITKNNIVQSSLLLFAFVASFSSYSLGGIKISYIVGIVVYFTYFIFNKQGLKLPVIVRDLGFIILASFIYAWVVSQFEGSALFFGMLGSLLLCLIVLKVLNTHKKVELFLFFFTLGFNISNIVVSLFFFVFQQYRHLVVSVDQHGIRLLGFFHNPNLFASAQLLVLPITVYFLFKTNKLSRILMILFVINDLFLLYSAQSRAAYIGLLTAGVIVISIKLFILFSTSKTSFFKTIAVVLALSGIIYYLIIVSPISNTISNKMGIDLSRLNLDSRKSAYDVAIKNMNEERFYLLSNSFKTFLDNPFGIGFQPHEDVIGKKTGVYKVAHNFIMTEFLNYGLVFGMGWVFLWFFPVLKGFIIILRNREKSWEFVDYLYLGYTSYLIYALAHSAMNWVYLWIYYLLLLKFLIPKATELINTKK